MKKNMEWISADADFVQWLLNNLQKAPEGLMQRSEWKQAFSNLMRGVTDSLLVEMDGAPHSEKTTIRAGDLDIDIPGRRVHKKGREVALTPKEFDILCFLARNRGEVFTKEQIYQAVWDENYLLDDSNIMAFIRKIRKKIETSPDDPQYILTIWGIGYKFNDEV